MLKNLTASMIIVWSLVIVLALMGLILDPRFLAISAMLSLFYIGVKADDS